MTDTFYAEWAGRLHVCLESVLDPLASIADFQREQARRTLAEFEQATKARAAEHYAAMAEQSAVDWDKADDPSMGPVAS